MYGFSSEPKDGRDEVGGAGMEVLRSSGRDEEEHAASASASSSSVSHSRRSSQSGDVVGGCDGEGVMPEIDRYASSDKYNGFSTVWGAAHEDDVEGPEFAGVISTSIGRAGKGRFECEEILSGISGWL